MVDAVHGPLGAPYAGAANVANYGIGGVQTAGKTGTAERGEGLPPHSWFIGFVAAEPGAAPSIAVAVIVEGAGSGSDDRRLRSAGGSWPSGCAWERNFGPSRRPPVNHSAEGWGIVR